METQQQHFMVGATLGTEDRGDICIRDSAGNLLYRMVPTLKSPDASLAEVLRVCVWQSSEVAKRTGKAEAVTPAILAGNLLAQYDEIMQDLRKQANALPAEQARELLATLERARGLSDAVTPIIAGLQMSPV